MPPVQKVKWMQWEFKIKGISQVTIHEESLKEIDKLWNFELTADIAHTDKVTDITTHGMYKLIGNATIVWYPNGGMQNDVLPEVKGVTIIKIEEL